MNAELFARPVETTAEWREVHKGHRRLIELADRHYTRQQPGTNQCCRPGKNLTFLLSDGSAAWIVWRPRPDVGRTDGLEAWECTLFRNEGARLSSDLVREATALTFADWGWPPRDGLITAVGVEATRAGRSPWHKPGHCYRRAGWIQWDERDGKIWLRAPHPKRVPLEAA